MKRIRAGKYIYKIWELNCVGYYPPEKRIVWEATNIEDGQSDAHDWTLKGLKERVDKIWKEVYEKRK